MSSATPSSSPSIRRALQEFAEARRESLSEAEFSTYRRILLFLELCINNYGHRNLNEEERVLCERHYHAEGSAKRHFFEVFGVDKLLPELDFFAHVYVKRDVFTSGRLEERAPDVVEDLTRWLLTRGYAVASDVDASASEARERRRLRTRAREAARRLAERAVSVDRSFFDENDYIECDDHPIARIDSGRFWLRVFRTSEPEDIGPLLAPVGVTQALEVGWNLSCALARVRGRWQLAMVDEVYPNLALSGLACEPAGDYNRVPFQKEADDEPSGSDDSRAPERVHDHEEDVGASSRG